MKQPCPQRAGIHQKEGRKEWKDGGGKKKKREERKRKEKWFQ